MPRAPFCSRTKAKWARAFGARIRRLHARQSPSEPFQPDKGVREVDEQGKADRGSHEVFDHEPILALRMGLGGRH